MEHEPSEVVLSAMQISDKVYVVEGDTSLIFGKELSWELFEEVNKVLTASSLFAAHREHGLFNLSYEKNGVKTAVDAVLRNGTAVSDGSFAQR